MPAKMCLLNSKLDLSLLFWQQQFFIALKSEDFFFFASGTGIYIMFYLIYLKSNYALYK